MENRIIKEWLKCIGIGEGKGKGSGYGEGKGYGYGYGYGEGKGYGYGYGEGIGSINGKDVFMIDGVQTIVTHIKNTFAKGFILNSDFTLEPCFVAKGNGYFAHGKNLKEAREALQKKIFENMDSKAAIEEFVKKFKKGEKYPGKDFFEWHHYLTGSCLMGRESFVKNHGLDLDSTFTVEEFINLCENDYGGDIIKQLKERWRSDE